MLRYLKYLYVVGYNNNNIVKPLSIKMKYDIKYVIKTQKTLVLEL